MKKIFTPYKPNEMWDSYWNNLVFEVNLKLCEGDQLSNIFHRYLDQNGKNLEAGCGLAKWIVTLSDEGYPIMGLDNHFPSLKRAKQNRNNIALQCASITDIPLEDNSLDAYISLGVVEHFEEGPYLPLREAYRVLKPGGIAIVETPLNNYLRRVFTNQLFDFATWIKKFMGKRYYFAEYRFSDRELQNFLISVGFEILEVTTKDYIQNNRSIGLSMEVPFFRQVNGDDFAINRLGQYSKQLLNQISPWISSACVVCIGKKPATKI